MTTDKQQQQHNPSGQPDQKDSSPPSVRVFISSTFRDMHAERDHLVTVVFPELRERCERLGLEFFDVDLRWGVPEKGADGEKANSWEYCKQWINRVEPFFVCILGQRYGYIPRPEDIRDPDDRKNFADLSITEMEIRHAVLTGNLRRRSYSYFRKTRVPETVDAATRSIFVEDDDKVVKLKREISKGTRPVCEYSCDWDKDHFAKLDKEFGQKVLEDLWSGVLRDECYVSKDVWRQVLGCEPQSDPRYTDESIPVPEDIAAKIVELAKSAPISPLDAEAEQMESFADKRLQWFRGRTKELSTLTDFVETTDPDAPRLAIVSAVPGQGKSALLAKLHQQLKASPHFVITHFVGATERSADPRALVKRLINELDRSGIAWPEKDQEQDIKDDFISQIFLLARRLESYAGKRRIVLLLDAVNQLSDGHDLNWLPQQLGPNVRIIVSCIEDPAAKVESPEQMVLQSLSSRYPTALRVLLSGLTPKDIRAIVVDYLHEYCKELDSPHIDALCNIPQASNPLYLLVALGELRTLGGNDMNLEVPKLIASLPKEYPDTVSLFRWVLQRLEVFGKEETKHWCLYLAHGRTGMASRELADLLVRKFGPDAALSALRIERGLRRYLQRRGGQLDLFHSQLRQAVFEQYQPQIEAASVHLDIAAYFCELADPQNNQTWNGNNPRAVSEVPYHAWKAKNRQLSYLLALDDGFLEVQQSLMFEDPDLPLRTIRYAIDVACEMEEPVRMAKFTLKHANFLTQQGRETPLDALLNPNLSPQVALKRAWKLTDLLDNQQRSYALLLLTWKLQQLKRNEEAAATLVRIELVKVFKIDDLQDLAVILLSQINPMEGIDLDTIILKLLKDRGLSNLTKYLINAGQFTEAFHIAQNIDFPKNRSEAFSNIAKAQAKAGQDSTETLTEALCTVSEIEDVYMLSEALCSIALAQALAGQDPAETFAETLRAADQIKIKKNYYQYHKALCSLAETQAQAGQFAEAFRTAGKIEDGYEHSQALCSIALAQALAGQDPTEICAEALCTAENIRDEWNRSAILCCIARAQAQAGQFAEAFRTADKIENGYELSQALCSIANALTQARQYPAETFTEALRIAGRLIDRPIGLSEVLCSIALAQARTGRDPTENFAVALRTTEKIEPAVAHALFLIPIAQAQAQAGQDSTETFAEAIHTTEKIEDVTERCEALCSIALAQALAGQDPAETLAETLRTADQIKIKKDYYQYHKALYSLAKTQAQVGQFAEAFRTAGKIEDRYELSKALCSIALAQARAGQDPTETFAESLYAADQIKMKAIKYTDVLCFIAVTQAEAGQDPTETLAKAFIAVGQAKHPLIRNRGFSHIAEAQSKAGQFAEALNTAGQLSEQESWRSKAFGSIAEAQIQAGQFAEALHAIEKIRFIDIRNRVLCSLATAQAKAGQFAEALRAAEKIKYYNDRSRAIASIAEAQAKAGQDPSDTLYKAIALIDQIPIRREDSLNMLAYSLSQIPSLAVKTPVLQEFLPRAAHYLGSAYRACGLLAYLYPSHATAIAKLLGVGSGAEET